jgi:hypothetical protein
VSESKNPKIPKGQFALIQAETRTGIVLGLDGKRFKRQGEWFTLFQNLPTATEAAQEIVRSNPEIECVIQDEKNQVVATFRTPAQ